MKASSLKNSLLIIVVIALTFGPLFLLKGANFAGTDDLAVNAVNQSDPGYKSWFTPIWKPPSEEVESFLFALQAAIGSGFVFFYIGYQKGKSAARKEGTRHD